MTDFLFWLTVFLICYTYLLYPYILDVFSINKKQNSTIWNLNENDLPSVDILLAVYNEEKVIARKIESIFETNYPLSKVNLIIGSDQSTDGTNEIIKIYQNKYPNIKLYEFSRSGKSKIVNQLYKNSDSEILILTDANVYFENDTIYQLVKHYKNQSIGLVGGNILNPQYKLNGISFQEKKYLERENYIKYLEGVSFGAMIGAFGGCYSMRRTLYKEIPIDTLVMDDFYLSMWVLKQNKSAINELDAISFEDVSNKLSEEFRRKVRISLGNFHNLFLFIDLLKPKYKSVAFCYFSHKVLRWFTPILLLVNIIMSLILYKTHIIYQLALMFHFLLILILICDLLINKIGWNFKWVRFVTHFYSMNLALLLGLIKYLKGSKSIAWKPTERDQ